MKKHYFATLFIITTHLVTATNTEAFIHNEEISAIPSIKILIGENVEGALVEAKGSYRVIDPNTNKNLSHGSHLKRYYLQQQPDGLKWGEGYPGIFQIKILPEADETSILVDGIQYKGSLEAYVVDGQIHLVNNIPIEIYLKSLLTEIFATSSLSRITLEALAIVARTDLYNKALQNRHAFWHLDAKKVGYKGYAITRIKTEIDNAVDSTQYLVMLHKNRPFPTTWTENCAGVTADFRSIFRKDVETPEGVFSSYARKDRERYKWKYSIHVSEFEKRIPIQGVKSIDLYKDPKTNKVYGVRIKGSKEIRSFDFNEFWNKMGKNNVRSNDMTVHLDSKTNQILFEGYGEGPGVGLCLFSATLMGKNGESAPQILANFYPFTSLAKLESIPEHMFSSDENFIRFKKKR
jgi:SpoIID/LytB domain protein